MESVVLTSSSSTNLQFSDAGKLYRGGGLSSINSNTCLFFANGYSFSPFPFSSQKLKTSSIIAAAKKNNSSNSKKVDTHSFVSKPDESTGIFPEAVLLKEVSSLFLIRSNLLLDVYIHNTFTHMGVLILICCYIIIP